MYDIHAIIVRKPIAKRELNNIKNHFVKDKNKSFIRETGNSYRIRNHSKQKFVNDSFRTKVLNDKVSLVFGKLKPEYKHLKGAGVIDYFKNKISSGVSSVKSFFTPRLDSFNNKSKATLSKYGNIPVKSMQIFRTPLSSKVNAFLNALSFGKLPSIKKKYGFDDFFHLALVCNLGNKNIMCQKLSVVDISDTYKDKGDTEVFNVDMMGKHFTINDMVNRARETMGDKAFFEYDMLTHNCQNFVANLLKSVGLYREDVEKFVYQNLGEIIKEIPTYSQYLIRGATDLDALINKWTGGMKRKREEDEKKEIDSKQFEFDKHINDKIDALLTNPKVHMIEEYIIKQYNSGNKKFKEEYNIMVKFHSMINNLKLTPRSLKDREHRGFKPSQTIDLDLLEQYEGMINSLSLELEDEGDEGDFYESDGLEGQGKRKTGGDEPPPPPPPRNDGLTPEQRQIILNLTGGLTARDFNANNILDRRNINPNDPRFRHLFPHRRDNNPPPPPPPAGSTGRGRRRGRGEGVVPDKNEMLGRTALPNPRRPLYDDYPVFPRPIETSPAFKGGNEDDDSIKLPHITEEQAGLIKSKINPKHEVKKELYDMINKMVKGVKSVPLSGANMMIMNILDRIIRYELPEETPKPKPETPKPKPEPKPELKPVLKPEKPKKDIRHEINLLLDDIKNNKHTEIINKNIETSEKLDNLFKQVEAKLKQNKENKKESKKNKEVEEVNIPRNFNEMTLQQLKLIVRAYNLHTKIKMSKLKKNELLEHINRHLIIKGDKIYLKNDNFDIPKIKINKKMNKHIN